MPWPKIVRIVALVFISLCGSALRAQIPSEEIASLPTQLPVERMTALASIFPGAAARQATPPLPRAAVPGRPHRYFFRKLRHPLTPSDVALRESVRSLGTDAHHFVRCVLKDHSVVTGAITNIGDERFFVRTGIFGGGRSISYRELSDPPRRAAAVGEHLKNGLEWSGIAVVAIPAAVVILPLFLTGVVQD